MLEIELHAETGVRGEHLQRRLPEELAKAIPVLAVAVIDDSGAPAPRDG